MYSALTLTTRTFTKEARLTVAAVVLRPLSVVLDNPD